MSDRPINPDREQQRKDNNESRRQSGLEPRPEDVEEQRTETETEAETRERAAGADKDPRRSEQADEED